MKKFLPVILLSLLILPMVAFAADPSLVICNVFDKIKTILSEGSFISLVEEVNYEQRKTVI